MDALSALRATMNPALLQGGVPTAPVGPSAALALRPLGPGPGGAVGVGTAVAPTAEVRPAASFEGVLGQFVGQVDGKLKTAGDAVHGLLSGEPVPLHRVMIAAEEASVSFQLMVEVRNKLLESYQELMRMQV